MKSNLIAITAILALTAPEVACALHPGGNVKHRYASTHSMRHHRIINDAIGVQSSNSLTIRGGSIMSAASDPSPATPATAYTKAVALGAGKAAQTWQKTAVLGVVSGCHIGFGAYLALSVGGCVPGIAAANPGLQRILLGVFGLPMGLFMTLVAGGELFTGNTAVVTAAKLEGKATWKNLAKNWGASFMGNLVGSLLLAFLATQAGTLKATMAGPLSVAMAKSTQPFMMAFYKGVLCNWLVCMAVWCANNASDIGSKALAVFLPISGFVALGLEHSVANMFMIPFGMLNGADITIQQFLLGNILPVTLGNTVGGAICVAGLYNYAFGTKANA